MAYKTDTSLATNSKGEIIANSITHGIGVGLSIAGLVFLVIRGVKLGSGWHLAGFLVFGISLCCCCIWPPRFTTHLPTNPGKVSSRGWTTP